MNKIVIVGGGLGGLITGILLKKARPENEISIYDANKIPGGFCTSFEKVVMIDNEKVKYLINIPLLVSDFGPGEPFDVFLKYIGVANLEWIIKKKLFQYYPLNKDFKNGKEKFYIHYLPGYNTRLVMRTPEEHERFAGCRKQDSATGRWYCFFET